MGGKAGCCLPWWGPKILDGGQGGASQCLQRPSAIWPMRSSGFYHKQQVHMGSDRWTMTLKGTLQPT